MPFPLTRQRRLPLPVAPAPSARLESLVLALRGAGAESFEVQDGRVSFRAPWSVTSGPLWAVSRGYLALEDGPGLRYSLLLGRGCLTVAVSVLLWVGFEVLWMGTAAGVAAFRGLIVWLCLWGTGYLWVAWRFSRFLQPLVSDGLSPS